MIEISFFVSPLLPRCMTGDRYVFFVVNSLYIFSCRTIVVSLSLDGYSFCNFLFDKYKVFHILTDWYAFYEFLQIKNSTEPSESTVLSHYLFNFYKSYRIQIHEDDHVFLSLRKCSIPYFPLVFVLVLMCGWFRFIFFICFQSIKPRRKYHLTMT